ncbi:hypothetical protein QQ045_015108 [Rhodiola kirilowii]
MSGGPWTFDNRSLILKPWSEQEEYTCGSVDALPVWIRLPRLKAHLADTIILSRLCSRLGTPICTDGVTAEGSSYNYARPVEYEWKPPRCHNCCNFGHLSEKCPEPNFEMMLEGLKEREKSERPRMDKRDACEDEIECDEETSGEKERNGEDLEPEESVCVPETQAKHIQRPMVTTATEKEGSLSFVPVLSKSAQKRARQMAKRDSNSGESNSQGDTIKSTSSNQSRVKEKRTQKVDMKVKQLQKMRREVEADSRRFGLIVVYASNSCSDRRMMWEDIEKAGKNFNGCWLCLGDFNCVRDQNDKLNDNRVRDADTGDFRKFMRNTGLQDLPGSGYHYTWSNNYVNPVERILCKLDRALGNHQWFDDMEEAQAVFLPPGISDHSPVLEKLEGYEEVVRSKWSDGDKCRNLFMIQGKLKSMKSMLKQSFVGSTRGMDKRVTVAREALLAAQSNSKSNPSEARFCDLVRRLAMEFRRLKYNQFLFNKQRTNAHWIKEGDANTKFFHSLLKSRRSRNAIIQITLGDGTVSTDREIIKQEFSSEQCRFLVWGATDKEIWTALNSIGADKSPGPNGFSSSFFKSNRSNAAYIALIPKSGQACKPKVFRPISCCNVTYKIVASLLASRLKEGDPLSPFLFTIAMEGLSRMLQGLNKAVEFYYHLKCHRIKLSHIMFADDLILFSSGRNSAVGAIQEVVSKFLECSGLSINCQKSSLFLGGMSEATVAWVEGLIGIKAAALPVRYLGLPLTSRSLSRKDCDVLMEKITSRLKCWINATCARFLWQGNCDKKGSHLVKWEDVCRDKVEGGLGLKNIEGVNYAMVIGQMWGKRESRSSLWNDWLDKYWRKGKHWWEEGVKANNSWVLKRLMQCREIGLRCVRITDNTVRWRGQGDGINVKDTYNSIIEHKEEVTWHKMVWNDFNAPRDSMNAWLVVQNRLLTKDRMSHWGFQGDKSCVLCESAEESRDHLFFACTFTKEVWKRMMLFMLAEPPGDQWELDTMVSRAESKQAEDR